MRLFSPQPHLYPSDITQKTGNERKQSKLVVVIDTSASTNSRAATQPSKPPSTLIPIQSVYTHSNPSHRLKGARG